MSFLKFRKSRESGFTFLDEHGKEQAVSLQAGHEGVIQMNEFILLSEYRDGQQKGEPCHIEGLTKHFSWKRGFQNCWTGYPNDGKSTYTLFLMVIKSLMDDWVWAIWSPEMISSQKVNGKVVITANDLINEIVWMLTGVTPYKHIEDKYLDTTRLNEEAYILAYKWVHKHFIFLNPDDKTPEGLFKMYRVLHSMLNYDGALIDPFKNIKQSSNERYDIWLEGVFAEAKQFAVDTNVVMNWIAHPKANVQRLIDGQLQPCNEYMLAGGAAWHNSMDGIYSIFRPNTNKDPRDASVEFINLKQRKQELVGDRGVVDNIRFDVRTRRYLFNNIDPIKRLVEAGVVNVDFLKQLKPNVKYVEPPEAPSINALPPARLPYADNDDPDTPF